MSELLPERFMKPPQGETKKDDEKGDKVAYSVNCIMVSGILSVHGGDGSETPKKSARLGSIYGPNHSGKLTV